MAARKKNNDRHVTKRSDGQWANKRSGNKRATSLHNTQAAAAKAARADLRKSGGGELNIHGTDGRIRAKDTVPPAKDPHPPKG